MRICVACSHGGHLGEAMRLSPAFEGHDIFIITYDSEPTRQLSERHYLIPTIGLNVFKMAWASLKILRILQRERPDVVLSTGAEIAVPALYLGKLLGARLVFIEVVTRVQKPTYAGRAVYPVADLFLVQWKEMLRTYGSRAHYAGRVM